MKTSLSNELTGQRVVPVSGSWNWGELRKINYFLENYDKELRGQATAKYAGEAKFFQAYFYFDKVKQFGDVPWYSQTINISDAVNLQKARDPRTLVIDSVINFAITHLGANKSTEKVTKWTALALKSRTRQRN